MRFVAIDVQVLAIPFKASFRHAAAERDRTQSIWVTTRAGDGTVGHGEGCPREYVTGESLHSAQRFIAAHANEWLQSITDAASVLAWVRDHREAIDANPAAWTAVELAILDALGKAEGKPLEAVLGLPPLAGKFRYTAVVGDAPAPHFDAQILRYQQAGFRDFKVKLSGERPKDVAKARSLDARGVAPASTRADANNFWSEARAATEDLQALGFPFRAVEEPLSAEDYVGMRQIARALHCPIILDESLARKEQLNNLVAEPELWLINVRISKMGGLLRTLDVLREARGMRLGIVIGAHVGETSVLTRAALTAARAAGEALVAQEGAFGTHLLQHDVVDAPLMFGAGGILDVDGTGLAERPGLGLEISAP
jgi:L-alanine-DL-glutamate epimerase-like enolase superfamily enzyme